MKDDPDRTEQFKRENRMAQMAKLRIRWESMGEMANIERALAAGTIQDLMDEVEAWQKAMQKAERDISELRNALEVEESAVNHLHTDRNNLRLEIDRMVEKLTAQRDEARRVACEVEADRYFLLHKVNGLGEPYTRYESKDVALRMGWDCFKEQA